MVSAAAIGICLSMISTYFGARVLYFGETKLDIVVGTIITSVSLLFLIYDVQRWLAPAT